MEYLVGVDIGGTGTDCVIMDEKGMVTVSKTFSTPPNFEKGVLDAIQIAAEKLGFSLSELLRDTRLFLHSTTIAENALVDGEIAKGGLLITKGFEETLFMTRGAYGRWAGLTVDEKKNIIKTDKPLPIISVRMIKGIKERTDYKGEVLVKVSEDEVESAVQELVRKGAEAIGVSFLWSFQNPNNENVVKKVVRKLFPELPFTSSTELAPVMGEYERTSSVALNICLAPSVSKYLNNLRTALEEGGFRGIMLIMQAYGGLLVAEDASEAPVGMIESGPASGLVESRSLGQMLGFDNIITADMGGTTFKAGVVKKELIEYQFLPMVVRYPYSLPKMDIVSIGLAGGSIVHLDPRTNAPQIGPRSAGARPGAVCYGFGGTEPTITDIDLLLGYLNSQFFLEGRAKLDKETAWETFESQIARPLGMDVLEAASEVYRLANNLMYDLLHKMTVEKGLDPREYVLFSVGGTAGMHLGTIAPELGVKMVMIPYTASVHGASGLISSNVVHEAQVTHPMVAPVDINRVNDIFTELTKGKKTQLKREGFKDKDILIQRSIDMRYRRQIYMVTVPIEAESTLTEEGLQEVYTTYERMYEERYGKGSAHREAGIQMISFRIRAIGLLRKPKLRRQDLGKHDPGGAWVETRQAYFSSTKGLRDAKAYDFNRLSPGNVVEGPSIIWSPITTIIVNPDQQATVDCYKNIILSW